MLVRGHRLATFGFFCRTEAAFCTRVSVGSSALSVRACHDPSPRGGQSKQSDPDTREALFGSWCRISLELHQVSWAGAWLVGRPKSLAELVRSASPTPFLDLDKQCSLCGQVFDRFCDHAAVCPRTGDRNLTHNAVSNVFYEVASEAGLRPETEEVEKQTVFLLGPAMIDLLTSGSSSGKT